MPSITFWKAFRQGLAAPVLLNRSHGAYLTGDTINTVEANVSTVASYMSSAMATLSGEQRSNRAAGKANAG